MVTPNINALMELIPCHTPTCEHLKHFLTQAAPTYCISFGLEREVYNPLLCEGLNKYFKIQSQEQIMFYRNLISTQDKSATLS